MKRCTKCGEVKDLSEFPTRLRCGIRVIRECCKPCHRATNREYMRTHAPEHSHYSAAYHEANREAVCARHRARAKTHPRKLDKRNPKDRTRKLTMYYVRTGKLVRPDACERCGRSSPLEAHHADYSKPLEVEFICTRCHGRLHRKYSYQLASE